MSDRHKGPRVFKSGSKKRKILKDRQEKDETLLRKIPKLNSYFTSVNEIDIYKEPEKIDYSTTNIDNRTINIDHRTTNIDNSKINNEENNVKNDDPIAQVQTDDQPGFQHDIGLWPDTVTNDIVDFWATKGNTRELQNNKEDVLENYSLHQQCFKNEKQFIRKCLTNFFERAIRNNEKCNRFWLCFSPTKGKVYCYVCKLFSAKKSQLSSDGFFDWKHANELLAQHETSKGHYECIHLLAKKTREHQSIENNFIAQNVELSKYWHEILKRLIDTIKLLCERGLAFRGLDETIDSPNNGNYLGISELISKYDPFFAKHISDHANRGKGHVNYLSLTICEEIIAIMGKLVLKEIVNRIKKSKYYSLSVDSTPDESNIDQLTVIIRYMEQVPTERFLTFITNSGHSGSAMADSLLSFLNKLGIDIAFCRGQSYDNAPNMSGKFNGMQAKILEKII